MHPKGAAVSKKVVRSFTIQLDTLQFTVRSHISREIARKV